MSARSSVARRRPLSAPRLAPRALAAILALAACRTVAPPLPDVPPAPFDDQPPQVALVLGGGGARGFAHVGVIRVLEDARVPIELIVGTSVGSLVGAIYAAQPNSYALERMARSLDRDDFFDFSLAPALFGQGLATGDRLERFVRDHVHARTFEALRVPVAAVATDLDTGDRVVLHEGDVARAVRASCAIPGVLEPVRLGGRVLVDGGVVRNLPVDVARQLGADVVIAVDLAALEPKATPRNFVEVIFRVVNLVSRAEAKELRGIADVTIEPAVEDVGFIDFDRKDAAIRAGMEAARAALPRIREVLAAWPRPASVAGAGTPGG
ncbi:patatin-like phospholipase family protein [Anaeromyxobacter terrae]|uniref:patatin-like phospholipase family protein n=1 Tax=Anaeromyxobacter terrae TaxID=2925406 RepID=UPI001F56356C|nr:patatin-like phospholipase family protein [Anaeromyxobacter sp. SG22]